MKSNKGFTLIELMVVVVIAAIIASVAVPAYSSFVQTGKLAEAQAALSDFRLRVEQFFQDNRSYTGACNPAYPNTRYFSFACNAGSATTYLLTATNRANEGLGTVGDFVYTIDQTNARTTVTFNGAADGSANWRTK